MLNISSVINKTNSIYLSISICLNSSKEILNKGISLL